MAWSTTCLAVSMLMSVSTAFMLAREAWQYLQDWLQRRVVMTMCRCGPCPTKRFLRRTRVASASTSRPSRRKHFSCRAS